MAARTSRARRNLHAVLLLVLAAPAASALPPEIAHDPGQIFQHLMQLQDSMTPLEFTDAVEEQLEGLDGDVANQVRERLATSQLERNAAFELRVRAEKAAANRVALQSWAQHAANILSGVYQELPPGSTPTGPAAAGQQIVRAGEYYDREIARLEDELYQASEELKGLAQRAKELAAKLQALDDGLWFWERTGMFSSDERRELVDGLQEANRQLPLVHARVIALQESLQNTLRNASSQLHSLAAAGIRSDPALLAADVQRRVNELVALQQDLVVSRLQFVAGQEQFDLLVNEVQMRAAAARVAGDDGLALHYELAHQKILDTFELWRTGAQASLAAKGLAIHEAYALNARDGLGPANQGQLIEILTTAGVDIGGLLVGRDSKTGEFFYPGTAERIAAGAESARLVALAARFGTTSANNWQTFAADFVDSFSVADNVFSMPRNFVAYSKGVGRALGDATHGLLALGQEVNEFLRETGQYYWNAAADATGLSEYGFRIDWFGQENIGAVANILHWGSDDFTGKAWRAGEEALDAYARRLEVQAGSGATGVEQAMGDVGYAVGTVATAVVGPEELAIRAAARARGVVRGLVAGADEAVDTVRGVGRATDAPAGGAAAAAADTPAGAGMVRAAEPPAGGAPPLRVAGEVEAPRPVEPGGRPPAGFDGEGLTPPGPGVPPSTRQPAGPNADTITANVDAGHQIANLRHPNGHSLRLGPQEYMGGGSSAIVFDNPRWPGAVIKVTEQQGVEGALLGRQALKGTGDAVQAPKVLREFNTPDGKLVQILEKGPASLKSDPSRLIGGRELSHGQQVALGRFLDDFADRGWVVADLKADNFAFKRLAATDEWVVVPLDEGMYLPMKSPDAARRFHEAILNMPERFTKGDWSTGKRLEYLGDLARNFDDAVDVARFEQITGRKFTSLAEEALNPQIARQFSELRAGDSFNPLLAGPPPPPPPPLSAAFTISREDAALLLPYGPAQIVPTGGIPKWAQDAGIRRLPGSLGEPPVPFVPASPAAERILHLPLGQAGFRLADAVPLLPVTTARFIVGQGAETTVVVTVPDDPAQQELIGRLVTDHGVGVYSDERRVKQLPDDSFLHSRGAWGQPGDDQWALKAIGLDAAGLQRAWDRIPADAPPVVVAVIDTGVAWNHRDLDDGVLWFNTGEIPGNGIDDDGNGYVDDIVGWNFVDGNNLPWDLDGHGTLVAGIIAARAGNGRGIAGVNPRARLMVLKALDNQGEARASRLAEAIVYAANNGAHIINLSVGGERLVPTEQLAIDYARQRGVLVVAAAGNEGLELTDYGPAGARGALTVAATDESGRRTTWSNWGRAVGLVAPGIDVLGPRALRTDTMANMGLADYQPAANVVGADGGWYRASGTSFAAPLVSGVASLLMAGNLALSAEQVERLLLHSAVDAEVPGVDLLTGYGRVDATAALGADPYFFVEAMIADVAPVQRSREVLVEIQGTADADRFRRAWVEYGAGAEPASFVRVAPDLGAPVRDGAIASIPATALRGNGSWTLRLVTEHEDGHTREARFLLSVD